MTFDLRNVTALLIDLDGVLYRGNTALASSVEFVDFLRLRRIPFRLVTNNATLTPEGYVAKLRKMGIRVEEREVFTSALATAAYLSEEAPGQSAFVIGEEGLTQALANAGIVLRADHPDWVVVGLDRHVNYEKLAAAALAVGQGARFLGTNPDTSFPSEDGLLPGAGALQAVVVATTGKHPIVVGKPEPAILELALREMGASVAGTAMLGDRLDTDIEAAKRIGMSSILVLTGITTREQLDAANIRPDLVVADLPELLDQWKRVPT